MLKKSRFLVACLMMASSFFSQAFDGTNGPGVDNTARPAGTKLTFIPLGGRMVTFHRGYLYIMGQGKTTLWDVSDATNPQLVSSEDIGDNGHRWWKLNTDIFWREYSMPEISGSGFRFMDMSDMLDLKPWDSPDSPVPVEDTGALLKWQFLETYPTGTYGGNVHDLRYDDPYEDIDAITSTFNTANGAEGSLRFRIGNLLFTTTGIGIAVLDIGDPLNIKFLDSYKTAGFEQYTTTYHVWRDKIIFLNGTNNNFNGNNMAIVDFSDPTNLKPHTWANGRTGFTTEEMSAGRYMYFQDEFGFAAQTDLAVKINMETGEIVQEFHAPGWPETYLDYQWMPLGPFMVGTGSNGGDGRSFFYQHQDGPDLRGPEVGFTSPAADSINNPVSTVIGFSIPEIIDERTATDQNIQVRAIGSGAPIEGDITWNSYHVLNFIPKQMLEANTTYEVRFLEDGLKDVAGNGIKEFIFYFSTGSELTVNLAPTIDAIGIEGNVGNEPVLANSAVKFIAEATDLEGDALEFRWDFGSGNSEWSSSNTASTSFAAPGLYTVSVQARDASGGVSGSSRGVVAVDSLSATQPVKSGALALDSSARKLFIANPDNNSVSILHADSLELLKEVPTCKGPTSVTIDAYAKAWVSCRDSDQLAIIDVVSMEQSGLIDLDYGAQPIAVLASPDGEQVYISLSGKGELQAYEAQSQALQGSLALEVHARAMAINASGTTLLLTKFISGEHAKVWQVDLGDFSLNTTIPLLNDTTTVDSGNQGSGLPNYLAGIAISPNSQEAFVVGNKANTDRGQFFGTEPLNFEFTLRSNISKLTIPSGIESGSESQADRIDIDNHAQPSSVVFSPYGTHLFVTMQGNNRLIVLNPNNGTEIARMDTGLAPQDVLIDAQTQRVFVKNFMGRSVTVFDAASMLSSGASTLTELATVNTVGSETLSGEVLAGKQLFYNAADPRMTLEGYLSCAGCHSDAGQDGRVWDFTARGEGLRNTIALTGRAGTAHGRLHWTANFDEIHDFEHDVRNAFSGSGFMADADFAETSDPLGVSKLGKSAELDALAAYHTSLDSFSRSPYRNADGSLTLAAQAGKAVFSQAGCANCHAGEAFTDSPMGLRHDVGTLSVASGQRIGQSLQGLDTPTLRDLWSSAPYLHDGSAADLEAVFSKGEGHGFEALSAAELSDLKAYLLQLDNSSEAGDGTSLPPALPSVQLSSISSGDVITDDSVALAVDLNIEGVSEVRYYANGEEIAQSSAAPFDAVWLAPERGEYQVQAKALYSGGATATLSADVSVQVGPSGECVVDYEIADDWGGGYRVSLVLTNESESVIEGINLSWLIGSNEQFATGWNASFSAEASVVSATIPVSEWNGHLNPAASITLGFQVAKPIAVAPVIPEVVNLNGADCAVIALD